jgi:hypothetical protein
MGTALYFVTVKKDVLGRMPPELRSKNGILRRDEGPEEKIGQATIDHLPIS